MLRKLRVVALWVASAGTPAMAVTLLATPAAAQSAADKATARTLAREGIKLFKAKKYQEALDKLQRAQALYDAPIHLIYIARCQVELGLLIDGAETYRLLLRTRLQADAPGAFKRAVADAEPELKKLEPRIPKLRIDVEPSNVEGLELQIDGVGVPAAVVGIDRPANPGTRVVTASAPGYKAARAEIELKEGGQQQVKLVLEKDPDAVVTPAPGPEREPTPSSQANDAAAGGTSPEPAPEKEPKSTWGPYVGIRGGLALPLGSIAKDPVTGNDVGASDQFQAGGGFEARLGMRFLSYFTGLLFYEQHFLKAGSIFNQTLAAPATEATTSTSARTLGLAARVSTDPNATFGGFGELGVTFLQQWAAAVDVSEGGNSCTGEIVYGGTALRASAGFSFNLTEIVQLSPFLSANVGSFDEAEISYDDDSRCTRPGILNGTDQATEQIVRTEETDGTFTIPGKSQATHALVVFGLEVAYVGF